MTSLPAKEKPNLAGLSDSQRLINDYNKDSQKSDKFRANPAENSLLEDIYSQVELTKQSKVLPLTKTAPQPAPDLSNDNFIISESTSEIRALEDFDKYRITKEKQLPEANPLGFIGEAPILAPGNITPMTAEGKGGKTAMSSAIQAYAISKDGDVDGFTNLRIAPNPFGKAVINIDTEQSEADQQYNVNTTLKRAGLQSTPDFYRCFNIRTLPLKEYKQFTTDVCELCNKTYNGIHLIIIDGVADYISSVNDEAEVNEIISFFTCIAVKYNCPVLLIIHLNENAGRNGDTTPRGHFKHAVRKGYCQLNITKEGDISTLQVLRARKASITDTPLVCYKYCKEKGYHVSIDAESVAASKQNDREMAIRRKAEKIAGKIFAPPNALLHKDAISKIMKETSKSEATAKRYLNDMIGWEIVIKHDDGYYRLKEGS